MAQPSLAHGPRGRPGVLTKPASSRPAAAASVSARSSALPAAAGAAAAAAAASASAPASTTPSTPPSPTKSLWRRFLSRTSSNTSTVVKDFVPTLRASLRVSPTASPATSPLSSPQPNKATAAPPPPPRQPATPPATPPDTPPLGPASITVPRPSVSASASALASAPTDQDHVPPIRDQTLTQSHTQTLAEPHSSGLLAPADTSTPKPSGSSRRSHRDVVPGLPRAQTFARQKSELRENLLPVQPSPEERRSASTDRRQLRSTRAPSASQQALAKSPRTSSATFAPEDPRKSMTDPSSTALLLSDTTAQSSSVQVPHVPSVPSLRSEPFASGLGIGDQGPVGHFDDHPHRADAFALSVNDYDAPEMPAYQPRELLRSTCGASLVDTASMTSSQYEQTLLYELEHIWILNLSMHFRDRSKCEKFFVTYRQRPDLWRRVTISLDYRSAPDNSLEMDLLHTKFQRDKNEKIYEAIRESLSSIQFYDSVTNLKLQTTDGRLHVHVVEDVTEIIKYPTLRMVQHLRCRMIREQDIEFDSHMSGFVYKVRVHGRTLIKKEIPGPDSINEFLYEVNALNVLSHSHNVIEFYGIVCDNYDNVTGLLISYAERGALVDIIYGSNHSIPWSTRAKWARQIVLGLSEIHESGYVQGDFTLSNIVIDDDGNAKIIDINRRGCPIGWEPPEATPLIENKHRISMYIGVKSDLYQLGMVLWALAMQDDEPEAHQRPLHLGIDVQVPGFYRTIVETCLSEDPRNRVQAHQLVHLFPFADDDSDASQHSEYYYYCHDEDEYAAGSSAHPIIYEPKGPPESPSRLRDHFAAMQREIARTRSVASHEHHGSDQDHGHSDHDDHDHDHDHDRDRDHSPDYGHNYGHEDSAAPKDWAYVDFESPVHSPVRAASLSDEAFDYPSRGRSPPNPRRRGYGSAPHDYFADAHRDYSHGDAQGDAQRDLTSPAETETTNSLAPLARASDLPPSSPTISWPAGVDADAADKRTIEPEGSDHEHDFEEVQDVQPERLERPDRPELAENETPVKGETQAMPVLETFDVLVDPEDPEKYQMSQLSQASQTSLQSREQAETQGPVVPEAESWTAVVEESKHDEKQPPDPLVFAQDHRDAVSAA